VHWRLHTLLPCKAHYSTAHLAHLCIRQHTSAYVSIRQHT
jgi:hypothetical protein